MLPWQPQTKKPLFFFFNQWNELLRGYMDNGGYCTYCTVNCTVSVTCPSSNIALRKSNTGDIHDPTHHNLIHDIFSE